MVRRELGIFGLSEVGDGDICFDDAEGEVVESDSLLWTGEFGEVEEPLMFPKNGSSLTSEQ